MEDKIIAENLPLALRESGLFCCRGLAGPEGEGKGAKIPYDPKTGRGAKSTDPSTFSDFHTALAALPKYRGLGVGIFGDLGALDIDHCIEDSGALSPMAEDIVGMMDSYTERSPSGQGLRILFYAPGFKYDKARYYINNQKLGLECYIAGATNKYVTVTGDTLTPGKGLEDRNEQLTQVLEKYMVRERAKSHSGPLPLSGPPPVDIGDAELIAKIQQSKSGRLFLALRNGDISGYKSRSEADIALCNMLAFWTGKDRERMDSLFRQSGLMREKWDRPTAGSTYGKITIEQAIRDCRDVYDPRAYFDIRSREIAEKAAGFRQPAAIDFADVPEESPQGFSLADLHPEENDRYAWTDLGNGNLFADWYRVVARYVPERKLWYIYTGKLWEPDTGNVKVMEYCKRLADGLLYYALSLPDGAKRDEYHKFVYKWQSRHYRETVLKDAQSVYPVRLSEFDSDPYLFNCQNGTLDLRTRAFHAHTPADMLSTISGVEYDPEARSELWEKTVSDVMKEDQDLTAYLQKSLGYALTGDTSEECLFLLYGPTTRNGKSTVIETFMAMMGGYGKAAGADTFALKQRWDSGAPSEDLAKLAGARAVNVSEPDKGMVLNAARVKTLTGNDTITARYLHENSFEYKPQFKLFINTNYLPRANDVTIFNSGRVKVIPFNRRFKPEEQDKTLKKRLLKELSGVLNWCLEGLWLMEETGFDPPEAVLDATAEYRHDSDKLTRFVEDCLEPDPQGEATTTAVYSAYQDWCSDNGQQYESMTNFKRGLEGFATIKRKRPQASPAGNPVAMLCGYRLIVKDFEELD